MKKMMKKVLCTALVILMCLTNAPLGGFVVLDFTAKAAEYQVGDIIEFGSYPQSEVKDETLIAELNALAPEWGDWVSYGYYSGTGEVGSMVQGDWMRYTDVTFEGERYRGVKFTQYRPLFTYNYIDQKSNGYFTDIVYWFKFETLKWEITDLTTGQVISNSLIDAQAFNNTVYRNDDIYAEEQAYAYFGDSMYTYYANNYEKSSVRSWLNNEFYNLAFSETGKEEIVNTEITNIATDDKFTCGTTYDKIYLLNLSEAEKYGYISPTGMGTSKGLCVTDYTYCVRGYCDEVWFLRQSGYDSYSSYLVSGDRAFAVGVDHISNIRPVFSFGDASKIHSHTYEITYNKHNTCQDGKVVYTCNCGATYREILEEKHNCISEITDEATHLKEGKKTYTCLLCDYSYVETIPKTPEHFYEESTVTPPTCTSQGYTTYACKCGDTYTDNYVDTIDHTYTESIISQPTCNTVGQKQFYCTTCHTYKYETIPTNDEHIDNDNNGYCDRCNVLYAYTEGDYHYTVKDGKATIIYVNNTISGDIVIPSTLGGYPVTVIGDEAFIECYYLTSVTIPETVTAIGEACFAYCIALKEVVISENVLTIGEVSFAYCMSLEKLIIKNSETAFGEFVAYTAMTVADGFTIEEWIEKFYALRDAENNGTADDSMYDDILAITVMHDEPVALPTVTIYSYDPSTAKTYAEENGIPFKNISELEEPHTCNFGEWFTETEPTVFSEGVSKRVCECGEFETKPIAKLESASAKDETTKVEITYTEENFESEVEIVVSEEEINANIVFGDEFENYKAYDISLEADGEKIQPKGYVTVKLPIPEGFNADSTVVYYVDDSGNKTKLESTTENGYIVFETDHFSEYVLVDESSRIEPPHVHSYTASITKEATCTENGTTTYTCSCGDSYNETIEATGHDFDGSKCKNCDYDKADTCGCNCHKGGFMGFIWKIINFFNKLFKSKQYCACGAKHW